MDTIPVLGEVPGLQVKLVLSLLTLVVVWVAHRLVARVVDRRIEDPRAGYRWSKILGYAASFAALVFLAFIWVDAFRNLATFLGLVSAGLAIALRDVVANIAGWVFIILRHPFEVGDRVQVGEHRGDVVDIRVFQFTVLEIGNWVDADQTTGRVIHVPNGRVFSDPIANYTAPFPYIWHEIPVPVTFESDWRKAKTILEDVVARYGADLAREAQEAVDRGPRPYLIFHGTLTPKVYTAVQNSGVQLTVRFLCPVRQRRGLSERIWEDILEAFRAEPDIAFAHPTQRVFANFIEGKEGARAEVPFLERRP